MQGLDFVFKGGTSLVLLFGGGNRFSIDIDIICKTDRKGLESVLEKVVADSLFTSFEPEEDRSYKHGIPKAHYKLHFQSAFGNQYSGSILLDVLIEDTHYPKVVKTPVRGKWVDTEGQDIFVNTPDIDSITGDKLTAFAPDTIGIPYFKSGQPFSMEICKQLFDLGCLFEKITDIETVAKGFRTFAVHEIGYRYSPGEISPEDVLTDTLGVCRLLAGRGGNDQKEVFGHLDKGIKSFGSGFLMEGHFRIEEAISASAKVAYLVAKIQTGNFAPIEYYKKQDVSPFSIVDPEWNFLNKLKKQPDKSAFFYWYKALGVLGVV